MKSGKTFSTLITTLVCVIAALFVDQARAVSIGGGPSDVSLHFFPDDTATYMVKYVASSSDDDICAYELELQDAPDGMFMSFQNDTEVQYRLFEGGPDFEFGNPPNGWEFLGYYGRLGPDVDLGAPDSPARAKVYLTGRWSGCGVGGTGSCVGVGVNLGIDMSYKVPEVPRTSWTFTNTSPHDIVDGTLYVPGPGTHEYMRSIDGLVIPAGGSLTVEGQMDATAKWSFGGILDAPQPEAVFAFDPAGESPEGKDFFDVFTGHPYIANHLPQYPQSGLWAALVASNRHEGWRPPNAAEGIGKGVPAAGHLSYFEPSAIASRTFDLYAFSTGHRVGGGGAAPIVPVKLWDPGTTPAVPGGGPGTWDTATANWSDGIVDQTWDNAGLDKAVFGGAAGEVTIDDPVTAGSLTFKTSGYVLGGSGTLTLDGGVGEIATGVHDAAVNAVIAGDGGLLKTGVGELVLGGANTYTGPTTIYGGVLSVAADANLGDPAASGGVVMVGGTLRVTSGFATERRITINGGSTIDVVSGTLDIQGGPGLSGTTGKLIKTGPGELKLHVGADPARIGDVEIVEGTISVAGSGSQHLGDFVNLTIQPEGAFHGGDTDNKFHAVTVNGGTFTVTGNGEPGQLGDGAVEFHSLSMTGGTVVIGTGDQGALLKGINWWGSPSVTTHPSATTALITTGSTDYPENQRMRAFVFDVADGDATIDLEVEVGLVNSQLTKNGDGVLRLSGRRATDINYYGAYVNGGTLELAKPEGVHAIDDDFVQISGGTVKLINGHQIPDGAELRLGGTLDANNQSETLGMLRLDADSTIDLGSDSTSVVAFADSRAEEWAADATLSILNWSGNPAGDGTEQLRFGTTADHLSRGQREKIWFIDPVGFPPGSHDARVLAGGELVPGPFLDSARSGNWNDPATWHPGTVVPGEDHRINVGNHTVTANTNGNAFSLWMQHSDSEVVVAAGNVLNVADKVALLFGTLDVRGTLNAGLVDVAPGTTLTLGPGAALSVAEPLRVAADTPVQLGPDASVTTGNGGSIHTLAAAENATLDVAGGVLAVHDASNSAPGNLTKQGPGTLWLSAVGGGNPLGEITSLTLAGGTVEIEIGSPTEPLDFSSTNLSVTANSALMVRCPGTATLGNLALEPGVTFTIADVPAGVNVWAI